MLFQCLSFNVFKVDVWIQIYNIQQLIFDIILKLVLYLLSHVEVEVYLKAYSP